eukprot:m.22865 g.22865  ORF g.22865 m.22865 type:complete len:700 (+) comp10954_c0_seq2:378-2477(+)
MNEQDDEQHDVASQSPLSAAVPLSIPYGGVCDCGERECPGCDGSPSGKLPVENGGQVAMGEASLAAEAEEMDDEDDPPPNPKGPRRVKRLMVDSESDGEGDSASKDNSHQQTKRVDRKPKASTKACKKVRVEALDSPSFSTARTNKGTANSELLAKRSSSDNVEVACSAPPPPGKNTHAPGKKKLQSTREKAADASSASRSAVKPETPETLAHQLIKRVVPSSFTRSMCVGVAKEITALIQPDLEAFYRNEHPHLPRKNCTGLDDYLGIPCQTAFKGEFVATSGAVKDAFDAQKSKDETTTMDQCGGVVTTVDSYTPAAGANSSELSYGHSLVALSRVPAVIYIPGGSRAGIAQALLMVTQGTNTSMVSTLGYGVDAQGDPMMIANVARIMGTHGTVVISTPRDAHEEEASRLGQGGVRASEVDPELVAPSRPNPAPKSNGKQKGKASSLASKSDAGHGGTGATQSKQRSSQGDNVSTRSKGNTDDTMRIWMPQNTKFGFRSISTATLHTLQTSLCSGSVFLVLTSTKDSIITSTDVLRTIASERKVFGMDEMLASNFSSLTRVARMYMKAVPASLSVDGKQVAQLTLQKDKVTVFVSAKAEGTGTTSKHIIDVGPPDSAKFVRSVQFNTGVKTADCTLTHEDVRILKESAAGNSAVCVDIYAVRDGAGKIIVIHTEKGMGQQLGSSRNSARLFRVSKH